MISSSWTGYTALVVYWLALAALTVQVPEFFYVLLAALIFVQLTLLGAWLTSERVVIAYRRWRESRSERDLEIERLWGKINDLGQELEEEREQRRQERDALTTNLDGTRHNRAFQQARADRAEQKLQECQDELAALRRRAESR